MLRYLCVLVCLIATVVLMSLFDGGEVFSHSGRTDSSGGHNNRKTGEYHYHGGGPAKSSTTSKKETSKVEEKGIFEGVPDGMFDNIVCRTMAVVDKDGKKVMSVSSLEDGTYMILYNPNGEVGVSLVTSAEMNEIAIRHPVQKTKAVTMSSDTVGGGTSNAVSVRNTKESQGAILYSSSEHENGVAVFDGTGTVIKWKSEK